MAERPYPHVTVTPKAERSLRSGHPWVYFDEITSEEGEHANGDIVDVYSQKSRYLGSGFYNSHSKIRVRLLSFNANDRFDEDFFRRHLTWAVEYRRAVMGRDFSCCRLVFGEADSLPGLTVDRYGDILVTQTMCLGLEQRKDMIFSILIDIFASLGQPLTAIFERNDSALRLKEGLTEGKGFYSHPALRTDLDGKTVITENGLKYYVNYIEGQKTGFFLDQKYNRLAVSRIAAGRRVLDCFTHTGAFGMNAVLGGAERVTSVDISASAIDLSHRNARLNGLEGKMDFLCADVFDLLTEMSKSGANGYDLIILDPPAFTKSNSAVKNAVRGYKEINLKAMRLLPRGGYLATCSCSHFMTDELFRKMLRSAAEDASVSLRQIEARQQSPDHPIHWSIPETDYLKFYIFQVV
ncbi:MAG: class I SAM-dependent rRNA methyltransferase [Oscillospiraceae bacterium]|nr:class I SAM-dependent rRNA methyltransferase [Oscillospiraceae bacterium]